MTHPNDDLAATRDALRRESDIFRTVALVAVIITVTTYVLPLGSRFWFGLPGAVYAWFRHLKARERIGDIDRRIAAAEAPPPGWRAPLASPPKPTGAAPRIACKGCGELASVDEMEDRICGACLRVDAAGGYRDPSVGRRDA